MMNSKSDFGEDIRNYCAEIGADPLLVQGAGGNASWKEGDSLWVKASGTWLANAQNKEIFIPVDLARLKSEIAKKNFSVVPEVLNDSKLKPSIETMLHALMPHRVVLHLHAIEVLAHLVRRDFNDYFTKSIGKVVSFAVVDYFKPGADLASAIYDILAKYSSVDVIFLKSHGVVIGGENINDLRHKLSNITEALVTNPTLKNHQNGMINELPISFLNQYVPVPDSAVQQLALNPTLFRRLRSDWALYPDHVVFLGPRAHAYQSWLEFQDKTLRFGSFPELIFVNGEGVFVKPSFTKSKQAQLRCYFDVLTRQRHDCSLVVLMDNQIAELLKWDAEHYRMNLAIS
jgi:rhamnose utilization protein RhaD (predicted bifunctional aldolase and dehydrogenase)